MMLSLYICRLLYTTLTLSISLFPAEFTQAYLFAAASVVKDSIILVDDPSGKQNQAEMVATLKAAHDGRPKSTATSGAQFLSGQLVPFHNKMAMGVEDLACLSRVSSCPMPSPQVAREEEWAAVWASVEDTGAAR